VTVAEWGEKILHTEPAFVGKSPIKGRVGIFSQPSFVVAQFTDSAFPLLYRFRRLPTNLAIFEKGNLAPPGLGHGSESCTRSAGAICEGELRVPFRVHREDGMASWSLEGDNEGAILVAGNLNRASNLVE